MIGIFSTFLRYYFPAFIWAGIIFYFSSQPGLRYFSETTKEIFMRKGAHFVEFSILTILLWRIFYSGYSLKIKKTYWLTLILSLIYGFVDEWHQTFVFGRTGKIIDAVFDGISVFLTLELVLIYLLKKVTLKNILVIIFSILLLIGLELRMIQNGKKLDESIITQKSLELKVDNQTLKMEDDIKIENKNSNPTPKKDQEKILEKVEEKIPDEFLLKVPFTSQAPFKKWDEIHEESCEEASIIMLKYFLENKELTPKIAEEEIQKLVKFQIEKNGDYKDTTAQETLDLFLDFYGEMKNGKNLKVIYDFQKEDLKKYLSLGFPIIIPAAGRELHNPNFTPPGPFYHNLVLTGYDGDMIITNDPGTRKGEGYKYNIDILYEAIHDFPGKKEDISQGQKAMIVVE